MKIENLKYIYTGKYENIKKFHFSLAIFLQMVYNVNTI